MARRELARQDLTEFCRYVDPAKEKEYQASHLQKIAHGVEDVESGKVNRLFVSAPPRHWKSSIVSEKFPAWYLGRNPTHSIGIFSHGAALPTRFSRSVRTNITSNPRFAELFPTVRLKDDSTSVQDWSLKQAYRSSFRSFGVGTAPTGEGFNLIIIDDPIGDAAEAYSRNALTKVWQWYQETLRDRLDPGGAIIIVMSRWSVDDPPGRLLKLSDSGAGEKWESLVLKAIAEKGDSLGRNEGEALWPEQWPIENLEALKKAVGARAFAARFQGSPRAVEGAILDSQKLKMIDASDVPPLTTVVRRWDLAFSDKQGADFLAGAKLGRGKDGKIYILHLKRVHGQWTQGKPVIFDMADKDGTSVQVAIESNGTQLGYYQDIKADKRMSRHVVIEDRPKGSKEMRASVWGSRLEDDLIYCVRGEWNGDLLDEMDDFPNSEHDDCVDAVSGGYGILNSTSKIFIAELD